MTNCHKQCVVSLGGSLIYPPGGIDTEFLKKFTDLIRKCLEDHPENRFFIVTGGGRVCRMYQEAARKLTGNNVSDKELDEIGIRASRQNAHLLHGVFTDIAYPDIIVDYSNLPEFKERVMIGAGWKPGSSTDLDAMFFAEHYDADTVVNLSNIDQLYDKDPKNNSDAKPLSHVSWDELLKLTGDTWTPGANIPFDPIAAKKAKELGKRVVILNGKNFENLEKYCKGDTFVGTIIE